MPRHFKVHMQSERDRTTRRDCVPTHNARDSRVIQCVRTRLDGCSPSDAATASLRGQPSPCPVLAIHTEVTSIHIRDPHPQFRRGRRSCRRAAIQRVASPIQREAFEATSSDRPAIDSIHPDRVEWSRLPALHARAPRWNCRDRVFHSGVSGASS